VVGVAVREARLRATARLHGDRADQRCEATRRRRHITNAQDPRGRDEYPDPVSRGARYSDVLIMTRADAGARPPCRRLVKTSDGRPCLNRPATATSGDSPSAPHCCAAPSPLQVTSASRAVSLYRRIPIHDLVTPITLDDGGGQPGPQSARIGNGDVGRDGASRFQYTAGSRPPVSEPRSWPCAAC
jgi:hypothetical protein